MLKRQN